MQIYARIKYPRTLSGAKKIISDLDYLWVEVLKSPRGSVRAKNFIKIIKLVGNIYEISEKKIIELEDSKEKKLHQNINDMFLEWAKKRKIPIK